MPKSSFPYCFEGGIADTLSKLGRRHIIDQIKLRRLIGAQVEFVTQNDCNN